MTFNLYSSATTQNSSTLLFTNTQTVSISGSTAAATSAGYTAAATGTDYWVATYNGDTNNGKVSSGTACEPVVISKACTTITTCPTPTVVPQGTATCLTDTATLSGGYHETGTITFTLYQGCKLVDTETVTVNGNGTYTTPKGYSLSACAASGVYQWDASYSGDGNNNQASDNNDPNEQVTVVNSCCNLQNIGYSVYNPSTGKTTTPSDLSGNTQQGDTITVTFTVPSGNYDQLSLVSCNAPEGFYNANDANLQTVFKSVTQVEGPGTHTLSILLPPNFYQVDFVCGTVITTLGPATSNNFYHNQNRFIDGDNGGVNPLGSAPLSVSGEVYNDASHCGKFVSGDKGIANATVTLSGTDAYGTSISMTATTNSSGIYTLTGLPFSNSAGYTVAVSVPWGDSAGKATAGTVNNTTDGTATTNPEAVGGIVLANASQTTGTGYNFGVFSSAPQLAAGSTSTAGAGVGEILSGSHLQSGSLGVAIDLPQGPEKGAELAAIGSAISTLNSQIVPLGVSFVEVSAANAASAPVHITMASTSGIGGEAQGVLGAFSPGGRITLINDWNWYLGSNPTRISQNQYDFQSVVTHELGHVLGLGENSDPSSAMSLYLNKGQVDRYLTGTDISAIEQVLQDSSRLLPVNPTPALSRPVSISADPTVLTVGSRSVPLVLTASSLPPTEQPSTRDSSLDAQSVDQLFGALDDSTIHELTYASRRTVRQSDPSSVQLGDLLVKQRRGWIGSSN